MRNSTEDGLLANYLLVTVWLHKIVEESKDVVERERLSNNLLSLRELFIFVSFNRSH